MSELRISIYISPKIIVTCKMVKMVSLEIIYFSYLSTGISVNLLTILLRYLHLRKFIHKSEALQDRAPSPIFYLYRA